MMHQPPPPMDAQRPHAPPMAGAPPPMPQPPYYQTPPPQYYQAPPPAAPPPAMWGQPPPQYQAAPPPQQPQQQPPQYPAPMQYGAPAPVAPPPAPGADEIRSLWIGDLQYWMDENFLYSAFAPTGQVVSVKIIRNKQTGQPEGYGFIEFQTRAGAEQALLTYNGQMMPGVDQAFRLNWATCGAGDKHKDDGADHTIFVGDLAADVSDYLLQETFKARYPSVKGAKVVTDRLTGRSKGYGFVRFSDMNEQARAMTEMNGVFCSSRPMRVGPAANKKTTSPQQPYSTTATYQSTQGSDSENDPNNTTVFVGGLDPSVTEDYLRQVFAPYGELGYVKIPVGKRCGFVQYLNRLSAEEAIRGLNGAQIGGQTVRLSWGRSPQNKQPQQDAAQYGGGYYGYPQSYDGYSYAAPNAQDPNMYAYGAYPGYGNYQQPQQQQLPQQ